MKKLLIATVITAACFSCRAQSIQLSGKYTNQKLMLTWSTTTNESTDKFEVEKSYDGMNFNLAALVFTSEKTGKEDYKYSEHISLKDTIYYRIKIFSSGEKISYSKVFSFPMAIKREGNSTK